MAQKFYELDIWLKGHELLMEIYEITSDFPSEEKFSLSSQIIRSANGIIAGIAESHGRYHYADKVRILYIARGELEETQSHLRVAFGRKYITREKLDFLDGEYEGLKMGINKYIQSLNNQKMQKEIKR